MNDPTSGQKRALEDAPSPLRPPAPLRPPQVTRQADESEVEALTDAQLHELKASLEERRGTLVTSIEGRRGEDRDVGREVGDEMDEANTEGATAMASKLLERDVQLLREIDRALAKMNDGTYGACEGTGEPIGYSRLKLRPWARFSVEYQEEIERSQRSRGA